MFLERRDREANYYAELQKQTLNRLQQLTGNLWTDYNAHDPGITIADVLNYALYELHYIFSFPFESFLRIAPDARRDYLKSDLFGVQDIFGESIVTPSDYEKLIIENIAGVSACHVSLDLSMRYRIEIRLQAEPGTAPSSPVEIIHQVEALYHSHRNLCENLAQVVVTDTLPAKHEEANIFRPQTLPWTNIGEAYPVVPETYHSVQNHFPECYGLSERGISANSPEAYKAQVMQLKGYLLIFDYLLADVENQAKNIDNLLSLALNLPNTTVPDVKIRDIGKLTAGNTEAGQTIHSARFWETQRSRFLDVLDTIYGEDTKSFFPGLPLEIQNRKRAAIVPLLPELNRNRFRSFNLLDSRSGMTGLKQIIGLITGLEIKEEIPVDNIFAGYKLQLIDDKTFFTRHKQKVSIRLSDDTLANVVEPVPLRAIEYNDSRYDEIYMRINVLWYNILYHSFMFYGSDISNYRIIDKCEKGYLLVFKIPKNRGWLVMGQFYDKELLIETANLFCGFIEHLLHKCRKFYLLEHVLLSGMWSKHSDCNRLSIVFPRWIKVFAVKKYQDRIIERLPAHVRVEFIALSLSGMIRFEGVYHKWRLAMSQQDKKMAEHYSGQLFNIIISGKNARQ